MLGILSQNVDCNEVRETSGKIVANNGESQEKRIMKISYYGEKGTPPKTIYDNRSKDMYGKSNSRTNRYHYDEEQT